MTWRVLRYFGIGSGGRDRDRAAPLPDENDPALMMTGDKLVHAILENIRLRRSVLVTGPRGCGKSYCAQEAIRLAKQHGLIGGSRFLQGNREIPRDTLSEDMLVVGRGGQVELLKALALRPLEESGTVARDGFEDWPAIPRGKAVDPYAEWTNRDWMVLFLDEINRFGDGFLDSLLALLEERKIVRRGEDYYVPIVVVATANPPGYDMTAKKLSPPLQARITRSFRVSQPDVDILVNTIMPSKVTEFAREYPGGAPAVPQEVLYLAAGTTLCLWGDPSAGSKGRYFLTRGTRTLLAQLMANSDTLAEDMRELGVLIDFGPDARAASDWVGMAMARAASLRQTTVVPQHLVETAVHVLSHKVREKFNEGANPNLGLRRDRLILQIVERVCKSSGYVDVFRRAAPPRQSAARKRQRVVAKIEEPAMRQIIGEFANARAFVEPLVQGYPPYRATALPTPDHVRIWVNTIDGVLQPYASPDDVRQLVHQGYWALVRALRPGLQLDMATVRQVGELYEKTFELIEGMANPAGKERASAARRAVFRELEAASQSPANPQNAPGTSGMWQRAQ